MAAPKYVVRKDKILFVDNEETCWDDMAPPGERAEVIEIGVAELSVESLQVTRAKSFLIRPQYSSVSEYCTELTGHTEESLRRHGRPMSEVLRTIEKEFGPGSKAWFAWGRDRQSIDRDAALKGTLSPFSAAYFDLGLYFSLSLGIGRSVGLTEAMEMYGIERLGRVHSGVDDAVQTARLWAAQAARARDLLLGVSTEEEVAEDPLPNP